MLLNCVPRSGAQWLDDGRPSEALCELQRAFSLPAPRDLLAHAQELSGRCLADTVRHTHLSLLNTQRSLLLLGTSDVLQGELAPLGCFADTCVLLRTRVTRLTSLQCSRVVQELDH